MTYRELYFDLQKKTNKYLNLQAIKVLLEKDGNFSDFFNLIKHFDDEVKDEKKILENVDRVKGGEPLQYVTGYAYFVNSNYIVNKDVLIPRQETEELAVGLLKMIVKLFGKNPKIKIIDIGTGSGVLGIYLKEYFPESKVICTDISENCLKICNKNAELHNVKIETRQGNVLDPIKDINDISVIVSNPPYIKDESTVDSQTLKYEPHLALFASPQEKFYEEILRAIDLNLLSNIFIIAFEIEENMKNTLTHILESKYKGVMYKFEKDICGKTRFLYIVKDEGIANA